MSQSLTHDKYHYLLEQIDGPQIIAQRLAPTHEPLPPMLPFAARDTPEAIDERWQLTAASSTAREAIADEASLALASHVRRNIENYLGTVKVPLGLAGPLRINGLFANGDYYIPLATTEAALVASFSRGMQLISLAGGCAVLGVNIGVSRTPGFVFQNIADVGVFVAWVVGMVEQFKNVAATTTSHGQLLDMRVTVEGNYVYLHFEFATGDASGQNMVTFATEAICGFIREHTPVKPLRSFLEANMSGDKKASALSLTSVRGRKAVAEVIVPAELIARRLHTSAEVMAEYWRLSALGGVLSGTLGVQGHFANGLAALYLACGQDVACVAESAIGTTRLELTATGDLHATVTLPNIMVGTVGGGTQLPSQRACLEIMGLVGDGQAHALAEICAAVCLAGELSLIGSICADDFARAHALLARRSGSRRKE